MLTFFHTLRSNGAAFINYVDAQLEQIFADPDEPQEQEFAQEPPAREEVVPVLIERQRQPYSQRAAPLAEDLRRPSKVAPRATSGKRKLTANEIFLADVEQLQIELVAANSRADDFQRQLVIRTNALTAAQAENQRLKQTIDALKNDANLEDEPDNADQRRFKRHKG